MNPDNTRAPRLFQAAFYTLLAAVVLAPIAFWPSQFFALESVKTLVIGALSSAAAVLVLALALKERSMSLPARSMVAIAGALALSLVISSAASGHFLTSFFGQGFEIGTGAFIVTLLLAGYAAFVVVSRKADRAVVLYAGLVAAYLILWIFQALRLAFGPGFASLGILGSATDSVVGGWSSFGMLSAAVSVIALVALLALPLSRRMKVVYWVLFGLSIAATLAVVNAKVWAAAGLAYAGLAIFLSLRKPRRDGSRAVRLASRVSWAPTVAAVALIALSAYGTSAIGSFATKINAGYTEIALPWQMTLDVASGELKTSPMWGAGPNRFSQAYLSNKPAAINQTDFWAVEFMNGFGLIPSSLVTQGVVGLIVWILFFVFFGILGVRSLRGLEAADAADPTRPYARFVMISSYAAAAFLWLVSIVYLPSHAVFFLAFVLTGMWLGAATAYGRLRPIAVLPGPDGKRRPALAVGAGVALVLVAFLGITYAKNSAALAYFGRGIAALNRGSTAASAAKADSLFAKAIALNPLDAYWRGRAESGIIRASALAAEASSNSASSTALVAEASSTVARAMTYAAKAVAADPDSYSNYVSQARVYEAATALKMPDAYADGVAAYANAIKHNPNNPSLYLSLARFEAGQNDIDKAIQAVGASLQVKNNYLDAVYALSQLEAAKGNIADAVTAAEFAVSLNPQNPLLYFQLGLLEYTRGNYGRSADAFAAALKAQPDYANAAYFLGLADARIGKNAEAISIFQQLADANPNNQDIAAILSTLRSGKSLFAAATSETTKAAVRPSSLPLKQK